MARHTLGAGFLILVTSSAGYAGPLDGNFAKNYQIGAAGAEPTPMEFTLRFRGGVRACVIARGDHNPIVPLDVTVYDKSGAVIVRDESEQDFVAVFWTPPRTAEYRIVVRNHGRDYNDVYVVFK